MRLLCASILSGAAVLISEGTSLACRELPYYQDYVCRERRIDVYVHNYYDRPSPPMNFPAAIDRDVKFRTYPEVSPILYVSDNLDGDYGQHYTRKLKAPAHNIYRREAEDIYRNWCAPREGQLEPNTLPWRIE